MNPDLFPILNDNTTVKSLLGTSPLRVFPYGRAPEKVPKPYAVYSVISGRPENYLDTTPDFDSKLTQISIYAETDSSLSLCYSAVRDALEPHAHMTSFSTPDIDADTNLSSCRMEFEFWDER